MKIPFSTFERMHGTLRTEYMIKIGLSVGKNVKNLTKNLLDGMTASMR